MAKAKRASKKTAAATKKTAAASDTAVDATENAVTEAPKAKRRAPRTANKTKALKIDASNAFHAQAIDDDDLGPSVYLKAHNILLPRAAALSLAAWLVRLADPSGETFAAVLADTLAVEESTETAPDA